MLEKFAIPIIALLAMGALVFMMYRSVSKLEAKTKGKSKKSRSKYLPQVKNPGK